MLPTALGQRRRSPSHLNRVPDPVVEEYNLNHTRGSYVCSGPNIFITDWSGHTWLTASPLPRFTIRLLKIHNYIEIYVKAPVLEDGKIYIRDIPSQIKDLPIWFNGCEVNTYPELRRYLCRRRWGFVW